VNGLNLLGNLGAVAGQKPAAAPASGQTGGEEGAAAMFASLFAAAKTVPAVQAAPAAGPTPDGAATPANAAAALAQAVEGEGASAAVLPTVGTGNVATPPPAAGLAVLARAAAPNTGDAALLKPQGDAGAKPVPGAVLPQPTPAAAASVDACAPAAVGAPVVEAAATAIDPVPAPAQSAGQAVTTTASAATGEAALSLPATEAALDQQTDQADQADQDAADAAAGEADLPDTDGSTPDRAAAATGPATASPVTTAPGADAPTQGAVPLHGLHEAYDAADRPTTFQAAPTHEGAADAAAGDLRDAHAARAGGDRNLTATAGRNVTQQVFKGLFDAIGKGGDAQQVTLKLNPESLGQVDLHFEAKGDHLTVTIVASSAGAEQAIREGRDELTERILQRGDRFQTVEIRVQQRDGAQAREGRADDRRDEQSRGQDNRGGGQGRQPRREPATTAEAWYDLARGGR